MSEELERDWLHQLRNIHKKHPKVLRQLPGGLHQRVDNDLAESVFAVCNKFNVPFEVKHLALMYFERILAMSQNVDEGQMTPNKSTDHLFAKDLSASKMVMSYLHQMLACVQVASKMSCSGRSIEPRHVNQKYPQIS